jgi:amino acid transporter
MSNMPSAKKPFLLIYPFLLALYPVVFLYAHNIDRVPLRETLRTAGTVLVVTGLLFLLVWALFRSAPRAALFSAWVMLLFSSYGHVYSALAGRSVLGVPLGYANVLAACGRRC